MPKMFVVAFAVTAVIFLILDAIWLGVMTRNLYQREIGDLSGLSAKNPAVHGRDE